MRRSGQDGPTHFLQAVNPPPDIAAEVHKGRKGQKGSFASEDTKKNREF
jgi:hypothetical protein